MIGRWLFLWFNKKVSSLPSCIKSATVAWWKNLEQVYQNSEDEYYIPESIGTETRDIYYGQYLVSGTIDFKRTSGTFDYTDPQTGVIVAGVSVPIDGLYTVPVTGICDIGINPKLNVLVDGLLYFDGVNDYVSFGTNAFDFELQEITLSCKCSLIKTSGTSANYIYFVYNPNNCIYIKIETTSTTATATVIVSSVSVPDTQKTYDLSSYLNNDIIEIELVKGDNGNLGVINSFSIDGTPLTATSSSNGINLSGGFRIGHSITDSDYGDKILFWDLNVNDEHTYDGYPNGNTNAAWVDTTGSVNGSVAGTPTTESIFDDDSDDIKFTSFYPICERAGTVLHDVMENSHHISATNPVWGETLYGSDYLNQEGYVTKADSDAQGGIVSIVSGLLNFDAINDYVLLGTNPNVTGTGIVFDFYASTSNNYVTFYFYNDPSNYIAFLMNGSVIDIYTTISNNGDNCWFRYNVSSLDTSNCHIVFTKNDNEISSLYLDNVLLTPTISQTTEAWGNASSYFGRLSNGGYQKTLIWDFNLNNEHFWPGHPNGNTDAAWIDTIGSINGTVYGSPTTADIAGTGYTWATDVDGTPVTLDDNTLVPLAQWTYEVATDEFGEPLYDEFDELIYLKTNI